MRRVAAFLAVAAALAIVGIALGVALRGDSGRTARVEQPQDPVVVQTRFEPDGHLFGEPVTAVVEVLLDSTVVDPGRIRLDPDFEPYDTAGARTLERVDHGGLTRLTYRFPLRCLAEGCEPVAAQGVVDLEPNRLSYRFREDATSRPGFETIEWRPFLVSGRVGERAVLEIGWRAPETELAAVDYRVDPRPTAIVLLTLAALLAAAAAAVAWKLWGGRPEREAAADEDTRSPLAAVLEAALAAAANGDVPKRRRALESVARELGHAGFADLAADARTLAWSQGAASRADVEELARRSERAAEGAT
jgi:hypothetical protein